MKKSTKAFVYQAISFAFFFIICRIILGEFSDLESIWKAVTSAVVATILAPKFQTVKTASGERLFVSWIFLKEVKELK